MLLRVEAEVKEYSGDTLWFQLAPGVDMYGVVATDGIESGRMSLYVWWDVNIDHPVVFSEYGEYEVWRRLSKVSGIGVLLGARILRVLGVDGLIRVLASGDISSLMKIKGVGMKLAKRIVSELADMVSAKIRVGNYGDIIEAFVKWGFDREQVQDVLQRVLERGDMKIDDLLAEVLKELAGGEEDDSAR